MEKEKDLLIVCLKVGVKGGLSGSNGLVDQGRPVFLRYAEDRLSGPLTDPVTARRRRVGIDRFTDDLQNKVITTMVIGPLDDPT